MTGRDARHRDRPGRPLCRLLPGRARAHAAALAIGLAAILPAMLADRSLGQPRGGTRPHRDVTVFGLRAVPGADWVDPRLAPNARPLRKLLPDHGLAYLDADSRRLSANESLRCDLDDGRALTVTLLDPLGPDGKVHLRVKLQEAGRAEGDRPRPLFVTDLHAPAGQLVFLDKGLPGTDARLLIGVGAR